MNVKSVIALILALVFQLVQVLPTTAAIEFCAPVVSSCECCDPADSCPCAGNDETPQNPTPLSSESGNSLKIPLAKASGIRLSIETVAGTQPSAVMAVPSITGQLSGYTGVRLSVAFCSFVI